MAIQNAPPAQLADLAGAYMDIKPEQKQEILERLNSSDEDLVGRTALLVDDDARNIFALSSVLERRGMNVLMATTGTMRPSMPRCLRSRNTSSSTSPTRVPSIRMRPVGVLSAIRAAAASKRITSPFSASRT